MIFSVVSIICSFLAACLLLYAFLVIRMPPDDGTMKRLDERWRTAQMRFYTCVVAFAMGTVAIIFSFMPRIL